MECSKYASAPESRNTVKVPRCGGGARQQDALIWCECPIKRTDMVLTIFKPAGEITRNRAWPAASRCVADSAAS